MRGLRPTSRARAAWRSRFGSSFCCQHEDQVRRGHERPRRRCSRPPGTETGSVRTQNQPSRPSDVVVVPELLVLDERLLEDNGPPLHGQKGYATRRELAPTEPQPPVRRQRYEPPGAGELEHKEINGRDPGRHAGRGHLVRRAALARRLRRFRAPLPPGPKLACVSRAGGRASRGWSPSCSPRQICEHELVARPLRLRRRHSCDLGRDGLAVGGDDDVAADPVGLARDDDRRGARRGGRASSAAAGADHVLDEQPVRRRAGRRSRARRGRDGQRARSRGRRAAPAVCEQLRDDALDRVDRDRRSRRVPPPLPRRRADAPITCRRR